jgi:hypothetical protein
LFLKKHHVSDNQKSPAIADEIKRTSNGAGRTVGLGH